MTVYVDNAFIRASVRSGPLTHSSRWCHMTADTTEELVAMAVSIGLQAKYIQHPGTWKEHFDVTEPKRLEAIRKGAVEVDYRERVQQMAERRPGRLEMNDDPRPDPNQGQLFPVGEPETIEQRTEFTRE